VASKGADDRRPTSGGGACGSGEMKRRRGIAFLPHEEELAGERAVEEAATTKIDTDGRTSRAEAASSVGDARDPVDSNKSVSEPRMRRRSEEEEFGSFTDGEGARAAAMAWRPTLRSVARACESEGGVGAWVCAKGGAARPWGRLYRHERGGEGAPGGHGHQWPCSLDGESRGGVKEGKQSSDGGRVKRSFTTA
jgi:hypothetical protein